MYSQDSFFDLSAWGQIGLAGLSFSLFLFFLYFAGSLRRLKNFGARIIGVLVLFWLFVWLSPQAYYLYYWLIFPDLPLQLVIKSPPSPVETLKLLVFQGRDNLSNHSKALMGWAMIISPFMKFPVRLRKAVD